MKKILFTLVALLSTIAVSAQQYYGRVQDPDGYTNIRRGPGVNYPIVRRYQSGDYLYYTPQSNGWSKVYSGDRNSTYMGYMATSRIRRVNPNSGSDYGYSAPASEFRSGYIVDPVDNYVNVRRGPGMDYAIVSRLNVGTFVYYKPSSSGWVKTYNRNKIYLGYVAKSRIN